MLDFPQDFSGQIRIIRCGPYSTCTSTGVSSPHLTVNKQLIFSLSLSADAVNVPQLVATVTPDELGDFVLDWSVRDTAVGQHGLLVAPDENGNITVPLDLSGVPDGRHSIVVTLSADRDGVGHLTSQQSAPVRVDTTPPPVHVAPKWPAFYPEHDRYRDVVGIRVGGDGWRDDVDVDLDIVNADGEVVRHFHRDNTSGWVFPWAGITAAGDQAPPGAYTLRATATDALGNTSTAKGSVVLSRKILVEKTFTKRLPAARTLVDSSVGRCSRLTKPSARGIAGSFGLYTNISCDKGWEKSVVVTVHALRVPAAVEYEALRVGVVGGAARSMPGSRAALDIRGGGGEWQKRDTLLGSRYGRHVVLHRDGFNKIPDNRELVWAVYTGAGARYDLTGFTIALQYKTLV